MIIIKVEKLKAKNSKKENLYVFISIIFIILFSFILLSFRLNKNPITVDEGYISSKKISAKDNITFTNLNIIIQDLNNIIDNEHTINMDYLGNELFYEPFIESSLDSHKWYEFISDKKAYFVGIANDKESNSNFILKIDIAKKEGEVRYSSNFSDFDENMSINSLENAIKNFKIIKSYTGNDFMGGN